MQYRRLGNAGVKLSTVGYGTWVTFGQQVDRKGADRMIGNEEPADFGAMVN